MEIQKSRHITEEQMSEIINAMKEQSGSIPDEQFPNFIFEPAFHEFDDSTNYWTEYDHSDPRLEILETMPKIKDLWRYIELKNLWEDYVQDVADKHSIDAEMVVEMFKMGAIEEYIPDPPILKKTKALKEYRKTGKMPDIRQNDGYYSSVKKLAFDAANRSGAILDDPYVDIGLPSGRNKEIFQKMQRMVEEESRVKNIYRSAGDIRGMTLIDTYAGQYIKNLHRQKTSDYMTEDGMLDLDAALRHSYEQENIPDYIKMNPDDGSLAGTKFIGGRFMTTADVSNRAVADALMKSGRNPMKFLGKGQMSKDQVMLAKQSFDGNTADPDRMTKKQRKKWKKEKEKSEMAVRRHLNRSNGIASMLAKNGFNSLDDIVNFDLGKKFRDE